jgi:hypothetical protein
MTNLTFSNNLAMTMTLALWLATLTLQSVICQANTDKAAVEGPSSVGEGMVSGKPNCGYSAVVFVCKTLGVPEPQFADTSLASEDSMSIAEVRNLMQRCGINVHGAKLSQKSYHDLLEQIGTDYFGGQVAIVLEDETEAELGHFWIVIPTESNVLRMVDPVTLKTRRVTEKSQPREGTIVLFASKFPWASWNRSMRSIETWTFWTLILLNCLLAAQIFSQQVLRWRTSHGNLAT